MQQVFAHNRNEISAFAAELVFCEVPGEFLQWGWDGEGVGVGIGGGVALIDAVGGGVAGVSPPPVCLCFLAADGLAFGLAAGALAVADSWVRIEPPQAIPAGALPQSGHPLLSARLSGGQLFVGRGGQVFASAEVPVYPGALNVTFLCPPFIVRFRCACCAHPRKWCNLLDSINFYFRGGKLNPLIKQVRSKFLASVLTALLAQCVFGQAPSTGGAPKDICAVLYGAGVDRPSLPPSDDSRLRAIKAEVRTLPGVVTYFPSTVNGKVVFVRLESGTLGHEVDERRTVSQLTPVEFRKWVFSARNSSNDWAWRKIAPLIDQDGKDEGKRVFFVDDGAYQILPGAFRRENALVVGSGSISRAIRANAELQEVKGPGLRMTALFGIPESEAEYQATFNEAPSDQARFGQLETWKVAAKKARSSFISANGDTDAIQILAGLGTAPQSKAAVLKSLEKMEGGVFIVAHSAGARIILATGERIEISPKDIETLKFVHSPFVFLRVCFGGDNGFAQAFLKAGARMVWTNRGALDVHLAVSQAEAFLSGLKSGLSIADAARAVMNSDDVSLTATVLSAWLLEKHNGGDINE
ncbi:MAG: hypothetical protein ACK55F_13020 [Acidobacteriota bacterium]